MPLGLINYIYRLFAGGGRGQRILKRGGRGCHFFFKLLPKRLTICNIID